MHFFCKSNVFNYGDLSYVSGITTQAHRFTLSTAEVGSTTGRRRKFVQQLPVLPDKHFLRVIHTSQPVTDTIRRRINAVLFINISF